MMPRHRQHQFTLIVAIGYACASNSAWAQEEHDLAKQLANPISSLISVPFQNNWDTHIGPAGDGDRYYLNFQPVIPVSLDEDWNLSGFGTQTGVGAITQSFFFSPKAPGSRRDHLGRWAGTVYTSCLRYFVGKRNVHSARNCQLGPVASGVTAL